jgi:hypothetical protein
MLTFDELVFNAAKLSEVIAESPRKNGSFNLFFKLSDKIGLKLCPSRRRRDENYSWQNEAFRAGLGPETYGIIDNVTYEGARWYGYFTEIAEVIEGYVKKSSDEKNDIRKKYNSGVKKLKEELKRIDFPGSDFHPGNIGWIDGRMVCIDFDTDLQNDNLDMEENF